MKEDNNQKAQCQKIAGARVYKPPPHLVVKRSRRGQNYIKIEFQLTDSTEYFIRGVIGVKIHEKGQWCKRQKG